MKTQGEVEAAICEGISRFEQEYMGRGPKDIHAHLIGDLLLVRLRGVLTAAEQQLVKTLQADKGRDLQAGANTDDRDGSAGPGGNGEEYHRGQGCEPALRHQHDDWRSSYPLHSKGVPCLPRGKEGLALLRMRT